MSSQFHLQPCKLSPSSQHADCDAQRLETSRPERATIALNLLQYAGTAHLLRDRAMKIAAEQSIVAHTVYRVNISCLCSRYKSKNSWSP